MHDDQQFGHLIWIQFVWRFSSLDDHSKRFTVHFLPFTHTFEQHFLYRTSLTQWGAVWGSVSCLRTLWLVEWGDWFQTPDLLTIRSTSWVTGFVLFSIAQSRVEIAIALFLLSQCLTLKQTNTSILNKIIISYRELQHRWRTFQPVHSSGWKKTCQTDLVGFFTFPWLDTAMENVTIIQLHYIWSLLMHTISACVTAKNGELNKSVFIFFCALPRRSLILSFRPPAWIS